MAFQPGDRLSLLARPRQAARLRPARADQRLRRPPLPRSLRGRVAARRAGAALGSQGPRRTSRSTSSRPAAPPASPRAASSCDDFRIDYELFSDTLPDDVFPKGANWLMLGPVRPAPAAAGGRAPGPAPRRHLLLRRPRSALGHQAHQEGLDGAPRGLQGARHRPGHDDPARATTTSSACSPRRSCSRRWLREGRRSRSTGITGIFCGGTEMTPQWIRFAIEELLGRASTSCPTYGNTLMGLACPKPSTPPTTTRSPTTPAAARRGRGRRLRRPRQVGRLRRDRPRDADDADEGVLHPALPGARRRRARAPTENYPWDGVTNLRPFARLAESVVVGVY